MVLADPAMHALATRSGAAIYCLTFAANRGSLDIAATVPARRILTIRTEGVGRLILDTLRVLWRVRREGIDTLVDLELFSRLSAVLCVLMGVGRRAGFHRFQGVGAFRGNLYTHPVAFNPHWHVAQNYLLLVEAVLGGAAIPAPRVPAGICVPRVRRRVPDRATREAVAQRVADLLGRGAGERRWVLVNANASDLLPQRRWPREHFVTLIGKLLAHRPDVDVLLIGAEPDRQTTAAIARAVDDPRCVDAAGRFSLAELPALFAMSAAMVSNDSGPAHFAAVSDLPVVALFGPETPVLFRPLGEATVLSAELACSPCVNVGNQRRSACRDNVCMQRISPETVLGALLRALASRKVALPSEEMAA